jgi:hypothetical protein
MAIANAIPGNAPRRLADRARGSDARLVAVRQGSLLPGGLDLKGTGLVSVKRHDQDGTGQYEKPHGYQG